MEQTPFRLSRYHCTLVLDITVLNILSLATPFLILSFGTRDCRWQHGGPVSGQVFKKNLGELSSYRLPHQTNRLALVFDPLGDSVSHCTNCNENSMAMGCRAQGHGPNKRILYLKECQRREDHSYVLVHLFVKSTTFPRFMGLNGAVKWCNSLTGKQQSFVLEGCFPEMSSQAAVMPWRQCQMCVHMHNAYEGYRPV